MNGKKWYRTQLQTPEWKKKRKEVYARDNFSCVDCGKDGITIHCHHLHYVAGKLPWEYDSCYLVTVCETCHDKRHCQQIPKFANAKDADIWYIFEQLEEEILKEELKKREGRINWLVDRGAVFDHENRHWGFVDRNGISRFYDEDGNLM